MLIEKSPTKKSEVSVVPTPVEVVLAEDVGGALSLTLPPLEDLWKMKALRDKNFSLRDLTERRRSLDSRWFHDELESQLRKEDRYGQSPIYLERLANLALFAGDRELEARYLQRAIDVESEGTAVNRLGENLINRNLIAEAEKLFSTRDLSKDIHANLRLAFFNVHRRNLVGAEEAVARALKINPFDYGSRLFNGSLNLVQGRGVEALHNFRIAEEEKPTSAVLFANIAIAYALLKNNIKALTAAKRAVALDPLNINAVCILADISHSENSDDDAIPALRYVVEFEQTNEGVWARLARALISIGSVDDGIVALQRQGSLNAGPEVWNNLGVAYHRKGRLFRSRAYSAFRHAAVSENIIDNKLGLMASKNLCALLYEDHAYKDISAIVRASIATDRSGYSLRDRQISDLYVFLILAEMNDGRSAEAEHVALRILKEPDANVNLLAWTVSWLVAYYSLRDDDGSSLKLIYEYEPLTEKLDKKDRPYRDMLINNIAFTFAELGRVDEAERYLQRISNRIHLDPFPTATLGLLYVKRGNIDKALSLYQEAIGLAKTEDDKARIRQKLNIELGRYNLSSGNRRLAARFFDKVIAQKNGAQELSRKAKFLKVQLIGQSGPILDSQ